MKVIIKDRNKIDNFMNYLDIEMVENIKFDSKTAVILGNFDGVHLGHMEIINRAIKKAKENNLKVILYTFIEYPKKKDTMITSLSEKIYILDSIKGIDYVYLDEFENVKDLDPSKFCEDILINKLNANSIFCGFNYSFGKEKKGDVDYLIEDYKDKLDLNIIDPVLYDFKTETIKIVDKTNLKTYLDKGYHIISSTFIKTLIETGNMEQVNTLLGHNYTLIGKVIEGKKLARTLGFPTANICSSNRIYPIFGVYGVKVRIKGYDKEFFGVMNIGKNPTVENEGIHIETHIFDFSDFIYGNIIEVELLHNIRLERKMKDINELKEQISKDKEKWRYIINERY